MTDKYIFKLLEKINEVVLIIENDNLKFLTEINEGTFNLPYLKNKDITKFLSKVIDKYQDKTLKLGYDITMIDSNNLLLKIHVWDGTKHMYEIQLKSKEIKDAENLEKKLKGLNDDIIDVITNVSRGYDDEIDNFKDDIDDRLKTTKKELITKYTTDNYRNYKHKSIKIVKSINKVNRQFELFEEIEKNKYVNATNDLYLKLYDELNKYEHFKNYINSLFNEYITSDIDKKTYYIKKYFMEVSIYNVLEFILCSHGIVDILSLNLDYNKGTYKVTVDISFIYDDSEYRVYKCFPNIHKQDLQKSKLIHHIINNRKDTLDIFIFQYLK
jgi:hypothetical protein